jgi:hypothetical protein
VIKHIVFWKLADEALGATKAENIERLKVAVEGLRGTVPGIRHLEVGVDLERSDSAWDLALYSEFDSRGDLNAYQVHPEHVKVAHLVAQVRTDRAVVDYEV